MRPLVAHCHLGLGSLDGRHGEPRTAREHRDMGMTYWQGQAQALLARQAG